jgi:CO/xanthine dehydrogenase FAD-binding subunit
MSETASPAVPRIEAFYAPTSLDDAVRELAAGDVAVVAGGTDLMVAANGALRRIKRGLMNVRHVPDLDTIAEDGGRIRVGALATMTDILESDLLRARAPILPAAADRFASVQIRNAATVGGNIANASPAADMVIPLLCLDAEVELASWQDGKVSTRMVAITDFFTGPGKSKREAGELITAVEFDAPADSVRSAFCKSGPRPALEIAIVSMGLLAKIEDGKLSNVRLAYGAVAPTPIRARETEKLLEGQTLDDDLIARAGESVDAEIKPIDDVRGTEWYRRHLAKGYLEQELRHVLEG